MPPARSSPFFSGTSRSWCSTNCPVFGSRSRTVTVRGKSAQIEAATSTRIVSRRYRMLEDMRLRSGDEMTGGTLKVTGVLDQSQRAARLHRISVELRHERFHVRKALNVPQT